MGGRGPLSIPPPTSAETAAMSRNPLRIFLALASSRDRGHRSVFELSYAILNWASPQPGLILCAALPAR